MLDMKRDNSKLQGLSELRKCGCAEGDSEGPSSGFYSGPGADKRHSTV